MRKIRIIDQISLDGVIQQSADENDFPYGNWTAPYRTPAGRELILAAYGESFGLLLGRRTYDMWSGFWPKAPSSPMADRLNAATKYIATHRPEGLAWGPAETLGSDIVEGIRGIKAQDGSDVILSGSSTLTSTLLEHGLADEVLLVFFPVFLGTGKRIFADGTRHAHSSSSARKLWNRASSSALTSRTDLCAPVPWAHRRKPTSESMGKREDSNEKANLRNQHYLGWLRRPHQTICR